MECIKWSCNKIGGTFKLKVSSLTENCAFHTETRVLIFLRISIGERIFRSEHEYNSPECRFVRNYTNPNVPLVLTLSALSPFSHHLHVTNTSSLVFSIGSGDWIAVASKESADVRLWRMDSVVQVMLRFAWNMFKFFLKIFVFFWIYSDMRKSYHDLL